MNKFKSMISAIALLAGSAANAALISESVDYGTSVYIDGSSITRSLSVTDTGALADIDVWVDFSKCSSLNTANGTCNDSRFSYLREIVFSITSPLGTTVSLVAEDTYTGGTNVSNVVVTFDDSSSNVLSGTPVTGTFNPVGSLSDFIGEAINGLWTLTAQDTVGADPLGLNAWGFDITTADGRDPNGNGSQVPVPAPLALLGLGLIAIGAMRRKA